MMSDPTEAVERIRAALTLMQTSYDVRLHPRDIRTLLRAYDGATKSEAQPDIITAETGKIADDWRPMSTYTGSGVHRFKLTSQGPPPSTRFFIGLYGSWDPGWHPVGWQPLRHGVVTPDVADVLRDLRAKGWVVAAHNDYRHEGVLHTFWLLTKKGRCIKAERVAADNGDLHCLRDLERQAANHP